VTVYTAGDRIKPPAHLALSLRNERISPTYVVGDFLDNSLSPTKGNATKAVIILNQAEDTVTVLDNGIGADPNAIITPGESTTAENSTDPGLFGVGATRGLCQFGEEWDIYTVHDGRFHHHHVDALADEQRGDWYPAYTGTGVPVEQARRAMPKLMRDQGSVGTMLVARTGIARRSLRVQAMLDDLSMIFTPALLTGRSIRIVLIPRGGKRVRDEYLVPFVPQSLERQWQITGNVDGMAWEGTVGVAPDLHTRFATVSIGYGHRVIERTTDPFGSSGVSTVFAEVRLSPAWRTSLSPAKDAVVHNREALIASIRSEIADVVASAREREDNLRTSLLAKDVGRLVSQTLVQPARRPKPDKPERTDEAVPQPVTDDGTKGHEKPDKPSGRKPKKRVHTDAIPDPDGRTLTLGGDRDGQAAAQTIHVLFVAGDRIDGRLAIAKPVGTTFQVEISEDHPNVVEHSVSSPPNMAALALIASGAVADSFALSYCDGQRSEFERRFPRLCDFAAKAVAQPGEPEMAAVRAAVFTAMTVDLVEQNRRG
jgi:hypothetical protein